MSYSKASLNRVAATAGFQLGSLVPSTAETLTCADDIEAKVEQQRDITLPVLPMASTKYLSLKAVPNRSLCVTELIHPHNPVSFRIVLQRNRWMLNLQQRQRCFVMNLILSNLHD